MRDLLKILLYVGFMRGSHTRTCGKPIMGMEGFLMQNTETDRLPPPQVKILFSAARLAENPFFPKIMSPPFLTDFQAVRSSRPN